MKKISLLLVAVFLLVGCNTVADFFVSDADEKEIGRQYHATLLDTLDILPAGDSLSIWINGMGKSLARYQDRYNFTAADYTFSVVNEDVVNAFAVPGGYIYMYKGLIEKAETADQIAAVMAHEIGHVAAEHYKEQVIKHNGLSFLASLVQGKSTAGDLATQVGYYLTAMKMSRNNEYEADSLAVAYLAEEGEFSPWGMKHFLDTLNNMSTDLTLEILKTHPDSDKRADSVKTLIETEYPQWKPSSDNSDNPYQK